MKAAFAKTDITPGRAVWLDGMIRAHRSTGVHDRLYARALALANDGDAADCYVIAALDLCGLLDEDARAVRTEAARRCGVSEDRMIIAATHTHSGPATVGHMSHREDRYVRWLIKRVAAVSSGWPTAGSDTCRPALPSGRAAMKPIAALWIKRPGIYCINTV